MGLPHRTPSAPNDEDRGARSNGVHRALDAVRDRVHGQPVVEGDGMTASTAGRQWGAGAVVGRGG
jgi:hypothetical protein